MSDLDQIAINDMKHELCEDYPCDQSDCPNQPACEHDRILKDENEDGTWYECEDCDASSPTLWGLYGMTREEWSEESPAETFNRVEMGRL